VKLANATFPRRGPLPTEGLVAQALHTPLSQATLSYLVNSLQQPYRAGNGTWADGSGLRRSLDLIQLHLFGDFAFDSLNDFAFLAMLSALVPLLPGPGDPSSADGYTCPRGTETQLPRDLDFRVASEGHKPPDLWWALVLGRSKTLVRLLPLPQERRDV
jgi:hypothetical protein